MNKQQIAEEYAKEHIDPYNFLGFGDAVRTEVIDAVLYGIGMGYDMGFKDGLPPVEEEQDAESLAKIKAAFGPHVHQSKPMRGGFAEEP